VTVELGPTRLRKCIIAEIDTFLGKRRQRLTRFGSELEVMLEVLERYTHGGKLLRPTFCYWGWRGAGGAADSRAILRAAGSLELLHASALVHDDVMDASDRRRGAPTAHRSFADVHRAHGWRGSDERFGASAAILLGDLCLAWSDEMVRTTGLPADLVDGALEPYDLMRTEVIAGQYLDLSIQATGSRSVEAAMQVVRTKSASYTVERPLQLGAALGGGDAQLWATYSAYGVPVGEAFQLRDDVLGVFGHPERTGKPAGDDIREGKRTVLLAYAYERSTADQVAALERLVGDPELSPDGVDLVRTVLVESGALAKVEQLIVDRVETSLETLDHASGLDGETRHALAALAVASTDRAA